MKPLYCPTVPNILPQRQNFFPSVLRERFYQVFLPMHSKSFHTKPAKHKKHHETNFQNNVRLLSLKRITWKQRRDILVSKKKRWQLKEVINYPVKIHFFRYGAVCSRSCFCVQQQIDYSGSYTAGTFKAEQISTYQIDSLEKEINKKLFDKADSLVERFFYDHRIKLANSQSINLDDVKTGVLL